MKQLWMIAFLLVTLAPNSMAASHTILLTGYWPPTNQMLMKFSQDPKLNPDGWKGKNWKGSGYDVVALFPSFKSAKDQIGSGPFRVDFAAVYNDFQKYTKALAPIAIVSFGQGPGPWEVETNFPNFFLEQFQSGIIRSNLGVKNETPIPKALTEKVTLHSSLPVDQIVARVNALPGRPVRAWADLKGNAGDYLCGFLGYLDAWYHELHFNPADPAWNRAAGFIHVSKDAKQTEKAVDATLDALLASLKKD